MTSRTIISDGTVSTLCRQCDMYCGINVQVENGRLTKITGDKSHPVGRGKICPKGTAALEMIYHHDRILSPLKRMPNGQFKPIPYDQIIAEIADKISAIKVKLGARSIGVWTGEAIGFLQQEEYARRFSHALGSPNYFSAESVCYAARHIAYYLVQGYYPTCEDYANSSVILIWGANIEITHPPFMREVLEGKQKGAKIVVIDPRKTRTERHADLVVRIIPGTDGALVWGLINHLIRNGQYDAEFVRQYTVGFDDFRVYAEKFDPAYVSRETGVPVDTIRQLAELIARNVPRISQYVGISFEHQVNGVNVIRAVVSLGNICGSSDIPGGSPWPDYPDVRSLTLYDHLPLDDFQPIGAERFPLLYQFRKQCSSLMAMDYMLGQGDYPLRGCIISGANPVLTNPNSAKVKKALNSLDLLVVKDLFATETARLAHYIIPAASFLERSELHYYPYKHLAALTRKVIEFEGVRNEYDFWKDLADALGFGERYFPWPDETAVNRWIVEGSGLDFQALEKHTWGVAYAPVRRRKFEHSPFPTPSGKIELTTDVTTFRGLPSIPVYLPPRHRTGCGGDSTFLLATGARSPFYYHSRYRNIERFQKRNPDPVVEINARDAERLRISNGEKVRIVSETGELVISAKIIKADEVLPGILQIGHGWDQGNVNLLTDDADVDPISGYPNLKHVVVRVEKTQSESLISGEVTF
jgi:anaerobic selenocysteine-containing dehydrogenase